MAPRLPVFDSTDKLIADTIPVSERLPNAVTRIFNQLFFDAKYVNLSQHRAPVSFASSASAMFDAITLISFWRVPTKMATIHATKVTFSAAMCRLMSR
jgi:hypothetical protein